MAASTRSLLSPPATPPQDIFPSPAMMKLTLLREMINNSLDVVSGEDIDCATDFNLESDESTLRLVVNLLRRKFYEKPRLRYPSLQPVFDHFVEKKRHDITPTTVNYISDIPVVADVMSKYVMDKVNYRYCQQHPGVNEYVFSFWCTLVDILYRVVFYKEHRSGEEEREYVLRLWRRHRELLEYRGESTPDTVAEFCVLVVRYFLSRFDGDFESVHKPAVVYILQESAKVV